MASEFEDRLDRNNRNITDNGDRLSDRLHDLGTKVAVLTSKMESLTVVVDKGFASVEATFRDINSRYATKEDIATVSRDVEDIRKNLTRGVWIVLAAVILAGLTLIFKVGLAHS